MHDVSKFRPSEWFAYAEYFYGENGGDGEFHEPGVKQEFDAAWLRHIHRNDHHHQHWILRYDEGKTKALKMPEECVVEMICDWKGAARAQGKDPAKDLCQWYGQHAKDMILHSGTRMAVETMLIWESEEM